jgi:hypothetical protein
VLICVSGLFDRLINGSSQEHRHSPRLETKKTQHPNNQLNLLSYYIHCSGGPKLQQYPTCRSMCFFSFLLVRKKTPLSISFWHSFFLSLLPPFISKCQSLLIRRRRRRTAKQIRIENRNTMAERVRAGY